MTYRQEKTHWHPVTLARKLARKGRPHLSNLGRKDLVKRSKGKKQSDLALVLNIDPTHFSRILSGERLPTLAQVFAIEKHLGTPARLWTAC